MCITYIGNTVPLIFRALNFSWCCGSPTKVINHSTVCWTVQLWTSDFIQLSHNSWTETWVSSRWKAFCLFSMFFSYFSSSRRNCATEKSKNYRLSHKIMLKRERHSFVRTSFDSVKSMFPFLSSSNWRCNDRIASNASASVSSRDEHHFSPWHRSVVAKKTGRPIKVYWHQFSGKDAYPL